MQILGGNRMRMSLFCTFVVLGFAQALLGDTALTVLNMCMAIILYLELRGGGAND